MSYIERSKQNAMDKEELKAFRARQADDTMAAIANYAALDERARNQAVIDSLLRDRARTPYSPYTGIDSNEFLQETQYMGSGDAFDADTEARMNNAVNASQGREVQGPSLYDQVKGYLGGMFKPAQQSPQVSAFAERERLAEQQRLDRIAQEAEMAQAAREYEERGNY